MRIPLCKKCKQNPRFSVEDYCIDCLDPEVLEQRSAEIRTNRALDDAVEIGNLTYGVPADEQGDL